MIYSEEELLRLLDYLAEIQRIMALSAWPPPAPDMRNAENDPRLKAWCLP